MPPRKPSPPAVSIILPVYNRADTIDRALDSVLAQTRADWELIVVDDGSTDASATRAQARDDPRIRLIRQPNGGVARARNAGLDAARAPCIAFLDSDDAWRPHHLALALGLLDAEPATQVVLTEFDQDRGDGRLLRHNRTGVQMYTAFARSIGSDSLSLPPGETDDYLRVYAHREPIGGWAAPVLDTLGLAQAWVYRGSLARHLRWGYLAWLPAMVLRRAALADAGRFPEGVRHASDAPFMGRLMRAHPMTLIGIPTAVKHERGLGAAELRQGHLATGASAYDFELNKMAHFREQFAGEFDRDPELALILRHYQLYAGYAGVMAGRRAEALPHLRAAACWKPHLRRAYALLALALCLPSDRLAQRALQTSVLAGDLAERLATGETTLVELGHKVVHGLGLG